MDYIKTKDGILLKNAKGFEPEHIFECGQCFRWNAASDGSYSGVAGGRLLVVRKKEPGVLFEGTDEQEFSGFWAVYFDLERDYGAIKNELSHDPVLAKAIEYGYGIRILKQDVWETLVSFIISANNRIPRIKSIIDRLCIRYGSRHVSDGRIYYDFPTADRLAQLSEEDILACGCGYRSRYVLEAARRVAEGSVDLEALADMDAEGARSVLLRFSGVGPKVADCIMLFSMAKFDSFPVDVWVKRVMEHYYLKKDTPLIEIRRYAGRRFGPLAGIAQQYLFYYARDTMGKPGSKR